MSPQSNCGVGLCRCKPVGPSARRLSCCHIAIFKLAIHPKSYGETPGFQDAATYADERWLQDCRDRAGPPREATHRHDYIGEQQAKCDNVGLRAKDPSVTSPVVQRRRRQCLGALRWESDSGWRRRCRRKGSRRASLSPELGRERRTTMARRSSSNKVTSAKVASQASKALADGRSSSRTKSIAASALAQAKSKKK